MKILSLSDTIVQTIYSPLLRRKYPDVDLIIACGDLPYYYSEYVSTILDAPLFFVRGNHDKEIEYSVEGERRAPLGGMDLHRRITEYRGLLLAGVEGSLRYHPGLFQYTQSEMWQHVFTMVPGFFRNKMIFGRYLDVFVSHAPPRGIHDKEDQTHQGINAFRWLLQVFQPAYHFHGHIHVYRPDEVVVSILGSTQVINTFGHRETIVDNSKRPAPPENV